MRVTPRIDRALRRPWIALAALTASVATAGCASAHRYAPRPPVVATVPSASAMPVDQVGRVAACPLPEFAVCGPAPCRDHPLGEIYAGAAIGALPSLGPAIEGGQVFRRTTWATLSFELRVTYQDLDSDPFSLSDGGTWGQVQGGAKASFLPCGRVHPTLRAGLSWFRTTRANDLVDDPGDYPGLYAGLGVELDVGSRFTTGPELQLLVAAKEGSSDPIAVPQLAWHFLVKF